MGMWEKKKHTHLSHFSDIFNNIIHTLGLREIYISSENFTWYDRHAIPTLERLDRVLM
jgi:hypothetical protein